MAQVDTVYKYKWVCKNCGNVNKTNSVADNYCDACQSARTDEELIEVDQVAPPPEEPPDPPPPQPPKTDTPQPTPPLEEPLPDDTKRKTESSPEEPLKGEPLPKVLPPAESSKKHKFWPYVALVVLAAVGTFFFSAGGTSKQPADKLLTQGKQYLATQKYQEAVASFTEFSTAKPQDGRGYYLRSQAKLYLGDYQGAAEDFQRSVKLDAKYAHEADYAKLCTKLAEECQRKGKLDECILLYQWGWEINKDSVDKAKVVAALYARGTRALARKAYDAALSDFQDVLVLMPGHSEAKEKCAEAYLKAGSSAQKENIKKAIEIVIK